MAKNHLGIR